MERTIQYYKSVLSRADQDGIWLIQMDVESLRKLIEFYDAHGNKSTQE